jgi:DNA-3-methyladenine glycosylase
MQPSGVSARQRKPLSVRFFNRDAATVARELLGKLLVRRYQGELLVGRVVEAEAYLGQIDPAAHAFAGQTPRNAVLFGPPGIAYVYFIYGNHYCLNVSCMPAGNAEGVLFRALEPVSGLATMAKLRGLDLRGSELTTLATLASSAGKSPSKSRLSAVGVAAAHDLRLAGQNARLRSIASGPGRLTQAMAITRQAHNGMALTSARSELFLADDGWRPERIAATPRINVTKAADRLLRFLIAGNPFVSAKRIG